MKANKIRAALVIALLSYCVIELLGCAKQEIKNIDSKGKNIVCLGDSLTIGYGVGTGEDYPGTLAKMVDIPVINAGVDGDTSTGGLRRIKSDVLDKDPLIVIIEFGGNDFLRKMPLKETLSNIEEMIEKVQANGAIAAIADIHLSMVMSEYGKELRKLAKRKAALFIPDLLNGILTNPELKSDFIHPNAKGYALVARRIYKAINPVISRNRLSRQASQ